MKKRPMCYGCGDKPAKELNLPGNYGQVAYFCSLRCAAVQAIEGPMVRELFWCAKHRCWCEASCPGCTGHDDAG